MLFRSIDNLSAQRDALRCVRYGMIEIAGRRFSRIVLRPWPKLVSILGLRLVGRWGLDRLPGDCVRLYYSQPLGTPSYLALNYIQSGREAVWADICRSLAVLDGVARLKRSDAIVCDVTNPRLSARLMRRLGWEPLSRGRWHRCYVRRFYGRYPAEASPTAAAAGDTTLVGDAMDAHWHGGTSAIAFPP